MLSVRKFEICKTHTTFNIHFACLCWILIKIYQLQQQHCVLKLLNLTRHMRKMCLKHVKKQLHHAILLLLCNLKVGLFNAGIVTN